MLDNCRKITVITVSKDAAGTVKDCLLSVNNQTLACEHIIIDGASTDGTLESIAKFASPQAKIVSEPDQSLYHALNKGLKLARGDVVGTLNADDFYAHDSVLEHVAGVFEKSGVDSTYGDLVYVDPENLRRVIRFWKSRPYRRKYFYRGWMPPHPTFFVKRSIYAKYGDFNLGLGTSADYELMLRFLLKHGISTHYIPEVLVIMRAGGVSNLSWANRLKANRMDRKSWSSNELKPMPWTLFGKPLSKVWQYWSSQVREFHPAGPWWPDPQISLHPINTLENKEGEAYP